MSIARMPSSAAATTVQFRLVIENAWQRDAVLNMGLMMANGKVLLPTALFLTITDSQTVGRELRFFSPSSTTGPVIRLTGKVDDYVVRLGPGATHTMTLDLGQYWAVATKQFPLKLSTGEHRVVAGLVGRGAQYLKGDMALLKFWTGTLQSNELTVYVPWAQPPPCGIVLSRHCLRDTLPHSSL